MCYDAKTSLITWVLATASSIYVLQKTNDVSVRWLATLIITFTLMQLIEGFIWLAKDNNKDESFMVKLILPVLLLQPLINIYWLYKLGNKRKYLPLLLTYIGIVIGLTLYCFTTSEKFNAAIGKNGHLIWKKNGNTLFHNTYILGTIYIVGLFVPMFLIPNINIRIITLALAFGTALWSLYNYNISKEFSSMWCFTAALSAVALLIPVSYKIISQ